MGSTILIIDDDKHVGEMMKYVLLAELPGNKVRWFDNGDDALRWAENNRPDLVIFDYLLNTVLCIAYVERLRSWCDASILICTGWDAVKAAEHCGVENYLSKPFQVDDFIGKVNALLTMRRLDCASSLTSRAKPA